MKHLFFFAMLLLTGLTAKSQFINNMTTCPIKVEARTIFLPTCTEAACSTVVVPPMSSLGLPPCATIDDMVVVYYVSWAVAGCEFPILQIGSPAISCGTFAMSGTLPACGPCRTSLPGPIGDATVRFDGINMDIR